MSRAAFVWYGIACLLAGVLLGDVTRPAEACGSDEEPPAVRIMVRS